jgi:hypothetical protein
MISISESSVDTVASALLDGNFGFFIDQLPSNQAYASNAMEFNKVENYRAILKATLERTNAETGACSFSREDLRVVFEYCVGGMPPTPNKFTSLLKHHRIHITKVRHDGEALNGIKTTFVDLDKWPTYYSTINPKLKAVAPAPKPKAKPKATPTKPKLRAVK